MIATQIYSAPPQTGGILLDDWSDRTKPVFSTDLHGFATCTATITLTQIDQFRYYEQTQAWLIVSLSSTILWEGRVEDYLLDDTSLTITAYGAWAAMSDLPVTALWSATRYSDWQTVETTQNASFCPDRFTIDTNNRLYLAPNGGDANDVTHRGGLYALVPSGGSRQIVAVSFTYKLVAPIGYLARLLQMNNSFGFLSLPWSLDGNGGTQTNTVTFSGLSGSDVLVFNLYRNQAAATLNAAILAGARTVTPSSMTGIKKGTKLSISGVDPEDVDVTAVTATTFTATFKYDHAATDTCVPVFEGETGDIYLEITNLRVKTTNSAAVYADEIIKWLVAQVRSVNPNQVNATTGLIQSPGIDLYNETYTDQYPVAILEQLAQYGDASGREWDCAIWQNRVVQFAPRGTNARTWYVDTNPAIERVLSKLINSVYAVYTDETDVERRTSASTNTISVNRYGLTRQSVVTVDTTSVAQAQASRGVVLNDGLNPQTRGEIVVSVVYDGVGNAYHPALVRAGDMIVARNLPAGLSTIIDNARSFRCSATSFDSATGIMTITPDEPTPRFAAYEQRRQNTK